MNSEEELTLFFFPPCFAVAFKHKIKVIPTDRVALQKYIMNVLDVKRANVL